MKAVTQRRTSMHIRRERARPRFGWSHRCRRSGRHGHNRHHAHFRAGSGRFLPVAKAQQAVLVLQLARISGGPRWTHHLRPRGHCVNHVVVNWLQRTARRGVIGCETRCKRELGWLGTIWIASRGDPRAYSHTEGIKRATCVLSLISVWLATGCGSSSVGVTGSPSPSTAPTAPVARGYSWLADASGDGGVYLFGGFTGPPRKNGKWIPDLWSFRYGNGWQRVASSADTTELDGQTSRPSCCAESYTRGRSAPSAAERVSTATISGAVGNATSPWST